MDGACSSGDAGSHRTCPQGGSASSVQAGTTGWSPGALPGEGSHGARDSDGRGPEA